MIVKALQRNAKTHAFDGEREREKERGREGGREGGREEEKPLHYNPL